MNRNVVLSLTDSIIFGAWVYRVDLSAEGMFNYNECVWLLSSCLATSKTAAFYRDEYVYIETLIMHAMYAYIVQL